MFVIKGVWIKMINRWNKFIYKIWSPVYDKVFNSGIFLQIRRQIFTDISFQRGEKILVVGVGTGADLELINDSGLDIAAIDFSPTMLERAKSKFPNSQIHFLEMDAQNLEFAHSTFDYIIASLIITVVPDANQCLKEMTRVVKPNGRIIIFDKFAPKKRSMSILINIIRPFIRAIGTDIGLDFEKIYRGNQDNLIIEVNQPVLWNGMYRKIILRKFESPIEFVKTPK